MDEETRRPDDVGHKAHRLPLSLKDWTLLDMQLNEARVLSFFNSNLCQIPTKPGGFSSLYDSLAGRA